MTFVPCDLLLVHNCKNLGIQQVGYLHDALPLAIQKKTVGYAAMCLSRVPIEDVDRCKDLSILPLLRKVLKLFSEAQVRGPYI